MSGDRFRNIADQVGRNPKERDLVQEALKAARDGRNADLDKLADQLIAKSSTTSPTSNGWLIVPLVGGAIFLLYLLRS